MANIDVNLESNLKDLGWTFTLFDKYYESTNYPLDATDINLVKFDDGFVEMKSLKLPKVKSVNLEWVMNKLHTDKVFQNFSENFKQILTKMGISNNLNIYPTTYGIGVFVAIGRRSDLNEIKDSISNVLNEMNIEYTNEYSEAAWVFRYKISKKKSNIDKIDAAIELV